MYLNYKCALITVSDISASRVFYEKILGQKVEFDHGENISFVGGFAIHLDEHFGKITGAKVSGSDCSYNHELYFETDNPEEIDEKLRKSGIKYLHRLREQPWGQRVIRIFDPDGHIVEIGETMNSVVIRLNTRGLSRDEIVEKSSMPAEFVDMVLSKG